MSSHDKTGDWTRFYVPEIHDVHPGMQDVFDRLLGIWSADARDRLATLVVPNWMDEGLVTTDSAFSEKLRALPGLKVLHGWTHSLGPDFWNWLLYGHDNRSEFASLAGDELRRRLRDGVAEFARLFGQTPAWFCAPRWQQAAAAHGILRELGFRGYMLRNRFVPFDGPDVPLHALCFDEGPRKAKAALLRRLREGTIDRMMGAGTPFRVTLHPDDVGDAATWDQVTRTIERLDREGWEPLSVDEAIARWTALSAGARAA